MMKTKEITREQIIEEKVKTMCDYLRMFYENETPYNELNIMINMCDELEIEINNYKAEYNGIKLYIDTDYNDYSYIVFYTYYEKSDSIFFTNETADHVLYEMNVNRY